MLMGRKDEWEIKITLSFFIQEMSGKNTYRITMIYTS